MSPGGPRRAAALAAAGALAAASLFLVHDHTRGDSFSADEPVHILAGYYQVYARTAIVNIEHPPLMKELAGLGLAAIGLPPPPARVPMGTRFTDWGHAFLFGGPVSPDAVAAAARAPFLAVLAGLLAVIFFAARARWGPAAAVFAVALVALDPNFVAHAGVVHTDLGASLAILGSVLAWDAAMRRRTPLATAGAGIVLGLAFATKFTAVYLAPILLLQVLLAARTAPEPGREIVRLGSRLAAAGGVGLLVLFSVYAVVTSRMDSADQRRVIHEMVADRGAPGLSRAIERVAAFSPPVGHYLGGLASVARQNAVGGGVNYLFGRASVEGFPAYFFVAFLLKSSLAFLVATAIVIAGLWRDARARREAALLLLPPAALFLASLGAAYNIGIRHMLPVYPFLALAAAGVLGRARDAGSRAAAAAMIVLPLLAGAELLRIHPHELSYFNPLAGGPEGGRRVLSDSNVDWGLDLKRLADELARRRVSQPTVVYFGGDDVPFRVGVPEFAADPVVRSRIVAMSAFAEAIGPEFYAYHGAPAVSGALERLRREIAARGRPVGRVGYSIHLYELPPKGTTTP
ncbi:MAG: glycosyltransferase family 39 protein [Acidobacteriota bacterium]